jgi:hypothetical protein
MCGRCLIPSKENLRTSLLPTKAMHNSLSGRDLSTSMTLQYDLIDDGLHHCMGTSVSLQAVQKEGTSFDLDRVGVYLRVVCSSCFACVLVDVWVCLFKHNKLLLIGSWRGGVCVAMYTMRVRC